ncbi:hypothetical protein [Limimaricola pyoseonensis]|uniref:Heme oxygenase n=1 Tax=Limimaricola pyoseonensis TaxID=521013 RepID=A0A1G7EC49_9RHOB|nr:hypothetical protein [Limimaricola pyoseonensis]SDE61233.1 hypothetical protein SAMN04488567_2099 [Limimaricola pyoseonensis]
MPLRRRLKSDLAPVHDRLDALFSGFDLRDPDDLGGFLAAHRLAFAAIRPAPGGATGGALLDRMTAALDADLAALGRAPGPALPLLELREPLAQDYVLLGSRLGTQVLARRWAEGRDPRARTAGRYLSLPPMAAEWRGFCEMADRLPGDDARAAAVLAEAAALFALFHAAGEAAGAQARRAA